MTIVDVATIAGAVATIAALYFTVWSWRRNSASKFAEASPAIRLSTQGFRLPTEYKLSKKVYLDLKAESSRGTATFTGNCQINRQDIDQTYLISGMMSGYEFSIDEVLVKNGHVVSLGQPIDMQIGFNSNGIAFDPTHIAGYANKDRFEGMRFGSIQLGLEFDVDGKPIWKNIDIDLSFTNKSGS